MITVNLSAKQCEKSYQTHQISWEVWSWHISKCFLEVCIFPRKPERKYHWFEIQPLRIGMKVRNLRHFVKLHFNISNSCVTAKMKWQIHCEKHTGNKKGKARWISEKCEGCFHHLSCWTHITKKAFYSNLNQESYDQDQSLILLTLVSPHSLYTLWCWGGLSWETPQA